MQFSVKEIICNRKLTQYQIQQYQGCIIYFAKFKTYKPLKVILCSVYGQDKFNYDE